MNAVFTAARRRLEALIAGVFDDSDGTYGYRRVHGELARRRVPCGLELVRAVMRDLGLYPCQPRPFRPTTTTPGEAAGVPDLVRRDFTAATPGTKLVGDITYIPTWRGWAYVATVIDCATRACIGWAIADHMRTELVVDALDMAAPTTPSPRTAYFIPTAARNTCPTSSLNTPPNLVFAARLDEPGCVTTMHSLNRSMRR